MKGIVVTTNLDVSIQDFTAPLYKSLGEAVGGYIEHVNPKYLKSPYCMIVNEEGILEGLQMNPLGSLLYGTQEHGHPIVGTIVFMKDSFSDGEPDIIGLDDESERIQEEFKNIIEKLVG